MNIFILVWVVRIGLLDVLVDDIFCDLPLGSLFKNKIYSLFILFISFFDGMTCFVICLWVSCVSVQLFLFIYIITVMIDVSITGVIINIFIIIIIIIIETTTTYGTSDQLQREDY